MSGCGFCGDQTAVAGHECPPISFLQAPVDPCAALQEDAREMAWLLRRCLAEADLTNAPELLGLLTAWTVTHPDEYPPPGDEEA